MAEIFPFRAYRYEPARVKLAEALTQPYDKITPEMQDRYYSLSPFNLIAIEKGRSTPKDTPAANAYTRAAQALHEWIAQGVLVRDAVPAIYVYSQEYQMPHSSERKCRKGFIALGRVEDFAAGVVFRHEQTLPGPRADRLELLRHTHAHTGQLFMLYTAPGRRLDTLLEQVSRPPAPVEAEDEFGVAHRLWPVVDGATVRFFQTEMADQKLVIADGHHRYETALAYRDECRARHNANDRSAPYEKVMMSFFNVHDAGLTILPTHRVVSGLPDFRVEQFRKQVEPYFEWRAYRFSENSERAASYDAFRSDLANYGRERRAVGVYAGGNAFYLCVLTREGELGALLPDISEAGRQLDVVLLHRVILEKGLGITAEAVKAEKNIRYEREMDAAIAAVDRGSAQLCCLLNPVRVEQVTEMALAGELLPQKSSDFYPKLLSGLTIYRLDE